MSDTELQFGQRVGSSTEPQCPTRCPRCGQHFSADAKFCPFDGDPLVSATDWDPSGDPLLDQVIDGRYCVEAVIGEGGMGTVYRVRHASLGRLLALKALRADLTNDAEIAARFIHEARIAASVSHPGLVQIVDFGTLPSGQPYLVMELLDGMPLSAVLRRHGPLSPARAAAITCKIADALAVLHAAQVVHRDLKPDNIQVRDAEGADEIKVVDFGLAKIIGGSRFTRQGVVFGTPHYMSPEQASGQSIDVRADVYALGVVLYEMLVGRVPFEAETYMGVLTQHIYLKPTPPSQRLLGVTGMGPIERIVLRCLQKRPERRFQNMAELVAAIQALPPGALPHSAPSEGAAPLPPPPPELLNSSALTRPPAAQKRFWAWVALGGVAAAGLGWWVRAALSPAESAKSAEPAAKALLPAPVAEPSASTEEPPPALVENLTKAREPSPTAPPRAAKAANVPKLNALPSALSSAPRPAHPKAPGSRAAAGSDIIDPWEKKR